MDKITEIIARDALSYCGDPIRAARIVQDAIEFAGYRIVPAEPTGYMQVAGAHVYDQRPSEVASVYRAMLAAALDPSGPSK